MNKLEEAEQAIDRLNSFVVDERIKNNSAMPFYNKAQETHDKEDIMKAIDAVNELEEGHMYKQALTQAVNAMAEIYGVNVSEETDRKEKEQELEEAEQAIDRLNSFVVDERIKNNSAMPFYNKAQETHDKEDIMKAINAVNELEEGHMYKQALTQAVNAMAEIYGVNVLEETDIKDKEQALEEKIETDKLNNAPINNFEENINIIPPTNDIYNNKIDINNTEEKVDEVTKTDNAQAELQTQLMEEKRILQLQLSAIDRYVNGEWNKNGVKTESFEARISKLEDQISQLKINNVDTEPLDPAIALATSQKAFEEIWTDKESTASKEEIQAVQSYRTAASLPTVDNVITALNTVNNLPNDSKIKNELMDIIIKVEAAYIKDEDEIKIVRNRMDELNLKPFETTNNNANEIAALVQQIEALKKEQELRTKKANIVRADINKKIEDINLKLKQTEEVKDSDKDEEIATSENDELPPRLAEEDKSKNIFSTFTDKLHEISEKKAEAKEQKNLENNSKMQELANYADKLHQIAEEGRIFNDENRIDTENKWMEQKTAEALGKYNDEEMESSDSKEVNSVKEKEQVNNETHEDMPPAFAEEEKDKFSLPHPIKAVQKASKKLIEKINTSKFKEKCTQVLEYLKKAKLAVATATAIIGLGILSANAQNNYEAENKLETSSAKEFEDATNNIANNIEKINEAQKEMAQTNVNVSFDNSDNSLNQTAEDIDFNNALQQQINEILNGQTGVYTSSDRAISGTDMKMPTASQIDNSWKEAQPGAYYDAEGNKISETDAMNMVESGEQVAARMDNDRGTAGYINIGENTEENTQGMSR